MLRTILVVDDEPMNRSILENMLKSDYVVLTASSGEEALSVLSEKASLVSAVLLDLRMPGMDGFAVLSKMQEDARFKYIPVIVVTAFSDVETEAQAVSLGAYGFISKPFKSVLIKHHLSNAISFRESAMLQNKIKRDELTRILNTTGFSEQAEDLLQNQPGGYYVLSCYDIDSFKVINDQYGTEMGDRILRYVANVLNESVSHLGGICCRVSEDSFMALYPAKYLGSKEIEQIHQKVISPDFINQPINIRAGRYPVDDVSVPVSIMYDRAVLAMDSIRGRYDVWEAMYDNKMREKLLLEQRVVSEMEAALAGKQFEVWFQPQYNHSTGALIGAEALVRWRHPERGIVPPGDFIPVFERCGFIYSLDKYVWEQVCVLLRKWLDQGLEPLPVSVNISRDDIAKKDIIDVLVGLIDKYNLDISLLRLEITETAFAKSSKIVSEVVNKLIERGFTVEIDDFGSGYSSLNTLKDVPAQILKLDMRFLENSADTQRGGNIVESVVRMAKWIGMAIIAEGVETIEQADFLRSIGCNYMQGYLYAKPMPVVNYEELFCGNEKEGHLLTLETVENLDNNSFWNPASMDTLIFNSYVGAACIYEYYKGNIELLRATEKYAQIIGNIGMTVEDALRINWAKHLGDESRKRLTVALDESIAAKKEVVVEYVFLDLPGCPHETFFRSTMRVIATVGTRYLIYCTNENITAQRKAEREKAIAAAQMQSMVDDMPGGFARASVEADGSLNINYVNDGFLKLVASERDYVMKVCADNALAGVHPDDVDALMVALDDISNTNDTVTARHRMRRGDGSYIWLSVIARVTKDVAGNQFLNIYYTDVSEQVKQEETQKSLLDNLPSGAGIYEMSEGQMSLVYQNKSFWELVGLNEEAYPDSEPFSAIHPEDIAIIQRELASAIEQNRDVACDVRIRHTVMGYRPVHLLGRLARNERGAFVIYATFTPLDTQEVTC